MSTVGWMSQKRISDLCHSLNDTNILVYSFPPSWVSLWGRGNLLRNTKNKVLTNQKLFLRYRTSNFGLERNERRQVLGICKEKIKTVLWKGWKKATNREIFLQASSLLFWSRSWSHFPLPWSHEQHSWRIQEDIQHLPVLLAYRGNLTPAIKHECTHPMGSRQVREAAAYGSSVLSNLMAHTSSSLGTTAPGAALKLNPLYTASSNKLQKQPVGTKSQAKGTRRCREKGREQLQEENVTGIKWFHN